MKKSSKIFESRLTKACEGQCSIASLALEFRLSKTTIRYWLTKLNLKTSGRQMIRQGFKLNLEGERICRLCNLKPGALFGGRERWLCAGCYTKIRRIRTKEKAVKLHGGCCVRCGWRGSTAAFDFHHKSGLKDFNIGSAANKSWEVVLKEIEKCELLCAICHRIEHSEVDSPRVRQVLMLYQGRE
jgi:hypothetical protein